MIDVISSILSDPMQSCMSFMFLESLAVKRAADVQQYDDRIIAAMKSDTNFSSMACSLLSKLATDEVHCVKKNIRRSTDILWRVFHVLTEPVTRIRLSTE